MDSPPRRTVLTAVVGSLVALAGCSTEERRTPRDPQTTRPTERSATAETTATTTTAGTATDSQTSAALDLREANVVGVAVEAQDDGQYRFDVTLVHDDDGEDGYANWWQVETTGGERLGRRELLHAHGTREFTRSETISVPEGVTRVVVRGHDQTHGYGGQAMVVDLVSGETRVVRQGEEREEIG
ncbi:hypothetical protein [Salinirubrum litoreum]|uniref:Uncharacterized protein n=1 Tax=Salinirubrum litoreum TaxID=1126234 RepID=A0ABD5R759_9EURY